MGDIMSKRVSVQDRLAAGKHKLNCLVEEYKAKLPKKTLFNEFFNFLDKNWNVCNINIAFVKLKTSFNDVQGYIKRCINTVNNYDSERLPLKFLDYVWQDDIFIPLGMKRYEAKDYIKCEAVKDIIQKLFDKNGDPKKCSRVETKEKKEDDFDDIFMKEVTLGRCKTQKARMLNEINQLNVRAFSATEYKSMYDLFDENWDKCQLDIYYLKSICDKSRIVEYFRDRAKLIDEKSADKTSNFIARLHSGEWYSDYALRDFVLRFARLLDEKHKKK
jgi:DNA-directed RNA polymerase delta subunit